VGRDWAETPKVVFVAHDTTTRCNWLYRVTITVASERQPYTHYARIGHMYPPSHLLRPGSDTVGHNLRSAILV